MARFLRLLTTELPDVGAPGEVRDEWVNVDHIVSIQPHLADSPTRGRVLSLELTLSSGDFVFIPVGTCSHPARAGDLAATAIRDLIETPTGEPIAAHVLR